MQNFHTSESHENWYNDVFGHAEHESGLIFIITITSNCISDSESITILKPKEEEEEEEQRKGKKETK